MKKRPLDRCLPLILLSPLCLFFGLLFLWRAGKESAPYETDLS